MAPSASAAQVTALAGTGLATIAPGFLAYDLADEDAAKVMGLLKENG